MKKTRAKTAHPRLVVITGLSGSGKGSALKAFEDLGYHCVDNLPVDLILKFADLCSAPESRIKHAAVVVDIREGEALSELPVTYQKLDQKRLKLSLLFLEAIDKTLIQRFEETRRPHPLGPNLPVREGIRLERSLLKPMRHLADAIVDTSQMNVHELRAFIQDRFGEQGHKTMLVSVVSFGFRFGVPPDADLVFDVRYLPNPNYVTNLRRKTGRHPAVQRYMDSHRETGELISRLKDLLLYLLPHYIREGKSYLTVAIGCTGGHHRSVALAERLSGILQDEGYQIKTQHRDIRRNSG